MGAPYAKGCGYRCGLKGRCHRSCELMSDGHAAVDGIHISGRERRLVRGEKHDDGRDLLAFASRPIGWRAMNALRASTGSAWALIRSWSEGVSTVPGAM